MKMKHYFIISIIILSINAYAVTVVPEIRTTVEVSKTDINRVSCANGTITSIDYAAGTGLTHKTHDNTKNIIFLFQQLNNGTTKEVINSKVNLLISCNNEYYPLILEPQDIDSQTIHLALTQIEDKAKSNKELQKKAREQILVDLIKQSRKNTQDDVVESKTPPKNFFIDKFQLQLSAISAIYGTHYQLKKYVVLSSAPTRLDEKTFLSSKISNYKIVALSLDDYELNQDKDWTTLHVVIDKQKGFQ